MAWTLGGAGKKLYSEVILKIELKGSADGNRV